MSELTKNLLDRLFIYDPKTGLVTRKVRTSNNVNIGDVVGSAHNMGYLTVQINKKVYLLHRIIWFMVYGKFPENDIDHINGDRSDNRLSNLRDVCHKENLKNKRRQKNNKSGVVGVGWYNKLGKWKACIMVDGRTIHLGYFYKKSKAIKARKDAEKEYGFHENHGRVA